MKKIFKVNLEEFKNEDKLKVFLDFIKSNKNKIKIIHNNKIKQLENELVTKKSKIKFILLDNSFLYQSYKIKYKLKYEDKDKDLYKMKYKIRDLKHEDKVKNKDEYKQIKFLVKIL